MSFLKSIKSKVWFCVGVGLLGFLVATVSTYQSNTRLTHDLGNLRDVSFPLSMQGEEARNLFAQQTSLYEDAFLLADEDSLAEGDALAAPIASIFSEMLLKLKGANGSFVPIRKQLASLKKQYAEYASISSRNYALLVDGADITAMQDKIRAIGTLQKETAVALSRLKTDLQLAVEADIASGETTANDNSRLIIILFLVVGLASIVIVNVAATRLLVRPVRLVQEQAARFAEGDFASVDELDVNVGGEIGDLVQAIRKMADSLRIMITDITASSNELDMVSNSLQATSGQVASSAKNQVDEVENTSTAMARIGESVAQVGEQMQKVSSTSEEITTSIFEQAASSEEIALNIDKLSESSEHVNSSIIQVSSNIQQISGSVNTLRDESDVTASSVAEMEASIRQVMQGAKDTAEIASTVHNDAEAGHRAVTETIDGMQRIKSSSQAVSAAIKSFSEQTENIGSILSVINNLADETNLLALNAAIIAAQAGEHGRGFAVVADQIKELADQTSLSTREIVDIIEGVRGESRNAVTAIIEVEKSINEGETLSVQSGAMLQKIVDGAQQAVTEMERISNATNEQVHGSGLIRASMQNVSDMVHQIVTAIDEQGKGSHIITTAAERVRDLVGQINSSIHEQSQASRSVASGMQDVNDMIKKVFTACEEQMAESKQITTAIDNIKTSAQQSLNSSSDVNGAVGSLEEQVTKLQTAVSRFNFS
jgi:methyl-accepting chemotaxis protein